MRIKRLLERCRIYRWLKEIRWKFIEFTNSETALGIIRGFLIERYYYFNATLGKCYGITKKKRKPPIIISLASIEKRLFVLSLCIESLLRQSLKPDYIILWLPDSLNEYQIPRVLLRQVRRGLQIRFCKEIGPFKKIFYTLKECPDSIIVTCDDDVIYPKDWLEKLYKSYERDPKHAHCYIARLIEKDCTGKLKRYEDCKYIVGEAGPSPNIFPVGVGGVLYPPNSLYKEVLNEEFYLKLCPNKDDIWLKAMSLLQGTLCKKTSSSYKKQHLIFGTQQVSSWSENQYENDKAIKKVFDYYNLYKLL